MNEAGTSAGAGGQARRRKLTGPPDGNLRAAGQHGEQPQQMFALERDASRRGGEAAPRHVHEDRAAAAGRAGCNIIAERDEYVVEAVVAPEAFVAGGVREGDFAVIIAVAGRVTPAVACAQR